MSTASVKPKYAIIRLRPQDDVFELFRLLLKHGYPEVSFVNELRDDCILPWSIASPPATGDLAAAADALANDASRRDDGSPPPADANSDSDAASGGVADVARAHNRPSPAGPMPMALRPPFTDSSTVTIGDLMPSLSAPMPLLNVSPMAAQFSLSSMAAAEGACMNTSTPPALANLPLFPPLLAGCATGAPMRAFERRNLHVVSMEERDGPEVTSVTTQLRQRGSRAQSDDPSVYASCRLCQNRIMASRLSNLTNHVRRHAILKQFQCCYCEYTHNEMAKVRLHMLHNHKDRDSQPIDNLSPEMQAQWDVLMEQCFPNFNKDSFSRDYRITPPGTEAPANGEAKSEADADGAGDAAAAADDSAPTELHTCIECGEGVPVDALASHIFEVHLDNCAVYTCSACGYDNFDQWKLKMHIKLKHEDEPTARVMPSDVRNTAAASLVPKFFRSVDVDANDADCKHVARADSPAAPSPCAADAADDKAAEASSASDERQLSCELCRKQMPSFRPLSSLLNHAKRHYHLKQFQCPRCTYSSSEAAHVRGHMKLKHRLSKREQPLDNKSPSLQAAWMQIMAKCFPKVKSKLGRFRFKNFRQKAAQSGDKGETTTCCRLCARPVCAAEQREHAASHMPLKPFACSACHYRAADYQQLRVHALKHKGAERPRVAKDDGAQLRSQYMRYCFGGQL